MAQLENAQGRRERVGSAIIGYAQRTLERERKTLTDLDPVLDKTNIPGHISYYK
jgi:hypothetical protein